MAEAVIPPIKRGTAQRLGLKLPSAYRQRVVLGIGQRPSEFSALVSQTFSGEVNWNNTRFAWGTPAPMPKLSGESTTVSGYRAPAEHALYVQELLDAGVLPALLPPFNPELHDALTDSVVGFAVDAKDGFTHKVAVVHDGTHNRTAPRCGGVKATQLHNDWRFVNCDACRATP